MTCTGKWKKNAGCVGEHTKVDPAEVDGAPRCRNWHCNSPLLRDGTCPHGCPQEVSRCPVCHRPSLIGAAPCENSYCGLNTLLEATDLVEQWMTEADSLDLLGARESLAEVKSVLDRDGPPQSMTEAQERLKEARELARVCNQQIPVREDFGVYVRHGTWDYSDLLPALDRLIDAMDEGAVPDADLDENVEAEAYDRYAEKRAKSDPRPPVARPNLPAGEHISQGVVYAPMAPPAVPPTVYCGVAPHSVPYARRQGLRPWRGMKDDISLVRTWPDPAAAFNHDGSFLVEVDTTALPAPLPYQAKATGAIGLANNVPAAAIKRVWKVDWMTSADAATQNAMILGDPGHGWVQAAVPLEDTPEAPRAPG